MHSVALHLERVQQSQHQSAQNFARDRGDHQRAEQEALNEALNEAGDRSGSGGDHHPNFEGEMEVCTKRHSKRKLQCASVPLALIVCRFIVAVCAMQ